MEERWALDRATEGERRLGMYEWTKSEMAKLREGRMRNVVDETSGERRQVSDSFMDEHVPVAHGGARWRLDWTHHEGEPPATRP